MHFRAVSGRRHMTFSEDVNNKINIMKALILENGSDNIMGLKLIKRAYGKYLGPWNIFVVNPMLSEGAFVPGRPKYKDYQRS